MADVLNRLIGFLALLVTAAIMVLSFVFLWGTLIFIVLGSVAACFVALIVIGVMSLIVWNDNRRFRRQVRWLLHPNPPAR